ncbi:hypothetical protein ACFPRL_20145 [Pseudoclavibacter helvolus]
MACRAREAAHRRPRLPRSDEPQLPLGGAPGHRRDPWHLVARGRSGDRRPRRWRDARG